MRTTTTMASGPQGPPPVLKADRPEWRRGTCPLCGSDVVSNSYRVGGRGYVTLWECMGVLRPIGQESCDYRVEFGPGGDRRVLGRAAALYSAKEQPNVKTIIRSQKSDPIAALPPVDRPRLKAAADRLEDDRHDADHAAGQCQEALRTMRAAMTTMEMELLKLTEIHSRLGRRQSEFDDLVEGVA